jgi:hypothetical protein
MCDLEFNSRLVMMSTCFELHRRNMPAVVNHVLDGETFSTRGPSLSLICDAVYTTVTAVTCAAHAFATTCDHRSGTGSTVLGETKLSQPPKAKA